MKLFLDRTKRLPYFVSTPEIALQLKAADRNVRSAASDFLQLLRDHTIVSLNRRYGQAFMNDVEIKYVLTVPAIWSDAAKDLTLEAAEHAGLGSKASIQVISEPEAAAVYAFQTLRPAYLHVGDNFIVCDAGGGTVDLIAYRITQLSPLEVEESAVGLGGLCGSAFLNYRFADHVRKALGDVVYNDLRKNKAKAWHMGLNYFEEFVKRTFSDHDDAQVSIPFPGLADNHASRVEGGFLLMTPADVAAIFKPVIDEVIGLVQSQVSSVTSKGDKVSSIILVGGFGQSLHLYAKLQQHFTAAPPPPYSVRPSHAVANAQSEDIQILQPLHAWTAVARGAALRGLELDPDSGLVSSRRSRLHYGTAYATVFDPVKHPSDRKYYSPLWERWMVADRMSWHLHKNQSLFPGSPITISYTRNFRQGDQRLVEDEIFACDLDEAPEALDTENMITVCRLRTDLSKVPDSLFSRLTTSEGVVFENLDFEIVMSVKSARLAFELQVDGVPYGWVESNFD